MRPTFSIIAFTVLSGAGYGLWFLLGLGLVVWWPHCGAATSGDDSPGVGMCVYPPIIHYALLIGFVLVSVGLLSSVAHLGQPLRAWRAFSQWRSSWLSREGVLSLLTYLPAIAIALWLLLPGWEVHTGGEIGSFWSLLLLAVRPLGALLALGALLTVLCTANIYASLKPIRAWRNRLVVPGYFLLGIYSGALLLAALAALPHAWFGRGLPALSAVVVALAAWCATLKYFYWRDIDRLPSVNAGHATGLASQGAVRSFEQPHTEENYLTHEMGFVLARKHAAKLRTIALISGFALPAMLAILGIVVPVARPAAAWCAVVFGFAGIFVERWLFFAEAKHAVIAYYGR
jgi:DMSO reductase anchor subunit